MIGNLDLPIGRSHVHEAAPELEDVVALDDAFIVGGTPMQDRHFGALQLVLAPPISACSTSRAVPFGSVEFSQLSI